jgi:hypothetical protein
MLRASAQHHLGYRQAYQLSIRQPFRLARPATFDRYHVIVNEDVECSQKGVQVSFHTPTMTPFLILPTTQVIKLNQESLV